LDRRSRLLYRFKRSLSLLYLVVGQLFPFRVVYVDMTGCRSVEPLQSLPVDRMSPEIRVMDQLACG
jgi:hypothetical protein